MLQGLKKLFAGQPDHHDLPVELAHLEGATNEELILANIELGRKVDALREQRKAIRARLSETYKGEN